MAERFTIDTYRVILNSNPTTRVQASIDIDGVTPFHKWQYSFRIFFFDDGYVYPGYDGYFTDRDGNLTGWILTQMSMFDPIYAVLRTESPVYGNFERVESPTAPRLRMERFNLTTIDEPVGGIEPPPTP